jgi:glycosyltransferase involved in cell wall biosynthesis
MIFTMTFPQTICLITGSYPPLRCGVGDYASQLAAALAGRGEQVTVVTSPGSGQPSGPEAVLALTDRWGVFAMPRLLRRIQNLRPDIVHLQYPTNGYGYRLGPQALVMLCRLAGLRVITTSHEFIRARLLRRLSLIPLFLFSHALILTSDEERAAIIDAMPWLRKKIDRASFIIPVGTNIPQVPVQEGTGDIGKTVAFFGLFYPGRMIETVVETFREVARERPDVRFRFIGDVHPLHQDYFRSIRSFAEKELPADRIEWIMGKTPREVALALSSSSVCLLPYPDGATFRRTTLMAALSLGVPIVTSRSAVTPRLLVDGQNILFAADRDRMAAGIVRVLADSALAARLSAHARELSGLFSWDRIVEDHLQAYDALTRTGKGCNENSHRA